ncbi:MAG: cation diffusion facilitator family transporter [Candidatus Ancaeobacter aquaticus]|nr:cation diffusion facilitator family transporter [Candidatus Ancaeobacter aquaticus]
MENNRDNIKGLIRGQRTAFFAAFVTLILAVMKVFAGYMFDSSVLIADAFHSGADLLAVFASGFGLWLASKKKSKRFPYGLYKAETLVTLIVGSLIVFAGIEILRDGYQKLFYIAPAQTFPMIPVIVCIVSAVTAYFVAKKEKAVGMSIGSHSLLANAGESFLDILTSIVVLGGIIFAYANIPYVEGSIIILISLLILKLGLENVWMSLLVLMDANLDPELQHDIEEKINKIYGVKGVSEVKIRQSGPFKMVECKIETSPNLPLYRAHELADKAEDFVIKNYKHIESVFIHIEPSKRKTVSAIIPVKEINGLESKVHGHFGRAPYFVIVKLNNTEDVEIEDFYYNEFLGIKKHIGIKVIKAVIRYKLDILFTSQIGEISYYMLKENYVDIYKVEEGLTVAEIIEKYHKKQVEALSMPTHPVEESESETTE